MMRALLPAAAFSVLSSGAFAHPGHGSTESASVSHYLLEPIHGVPLAVIVIATTTGWLWLRHQKHNRLAKQVAKRASQD